jgi:hypothetical protein
MPPIPNVWSEAIDSDDIDHFTFLIELRTPNTINTLYEYPDGESYTILDYVLKRARRYRTNQNVPIITMYKMLLEKGAKTAAEIKPPPVYNQYEFNQSEFNEPANYVNYASYLPPRANPRIGRPPRPPKTVKNNKPTTLSNGIAFLKRNPKMRKTRRTRKTRKARK